MGTVLNKNVRKDFPLLANTMNGKPLVYLDNGVKDCSGCLVPHGRGSYSYIMKKYPELMELAKKNR